MKYNILFYKIKYSNFNKISSLSSQTEAFNLESHDGFVINYTDVKLPDNIKLLLSADPNFSVLSRVKDVPTPTIVKELEYCISKLSINEDNKNILRTQTTNIITNFYNKNGNRDNYRNTIVKYFLATRRFLNANKNFLVMRSGEGNSTVVMRRNEYMTYMSDMLQDENSYEILRDGPIKKYQHGANEVVSELQQNKIITEHEKRRLKIHNAVPPKLYGLRKTQT